MTQKVRGGEEEQSRDKEGGRERERELKGSRGGLEFLIYHFGLIKIDRDGEAPGRPIYTQADGRIRAKKKKKKNTRRGSLFQARAARRWARAPVCAKSKLTGKKNRISICLPERQTERKQGWKSHEGGVHKGFGS